MKKLINWLESDPEYREKWDRYEEIIRFHSLSKCKKALKKIANEIDSIYYETQIAPAINDMNSRDVAQEIDNQLESTSLVDFETQLINYF